MSAVRMCDQCGSIFSEREDGWETAQAQKITRKDGQQRVQVENVDRCPACANGSHIPRPRLSLVEAVKSGDAATVAATMVDAEVTE